MLEIRYLYPPVFVSQGLQGVKSEQSMLEIKSFDDLLNEFLRLPLEAQIAIIEHYNPSSSNLSIDSETDLISPSRVRPPLE